MPAEMMPLVSVVCSPPIREQNRRPYHHEANHQHNQRHYSALTLLLTRREGNGEYYHRQSEGDYQSPRLNVHIAQIVGYLTRLHKIGAIQEAPDAGR